MMRYFAMKKDKIFKYILTSVKSHVCAKEISYILTFPAFPRISTCPPSMHYEIYSGTMFLSRNFKERLNKMQEQRLNKMQERIRKSNEKI